MEATLVPCPKLADELHLAFIIYHLAFISFNVQCSMFALDSLLNGRNKGFSRMYLSASDPRNVTVSQCSMFNVQ